MAIVFNQEGLNAIQPPCVVQNFINHNAVLYKVFVVGESYTVVQRPSLKNFSAGTSGNQSQRRRGCPPSSGLTGTQHKPLPLRVVPGGRSYDPKVDRIVYGT